MSAGLRRQTVTRRWPAWAIPLMGAIVACAPASPCAGPGPSQHDLADWRGGGANEPQMRTDMQHQCAIGAIENLAESNCEDGGAHMTIMTRSEMTEWYWSPTGVLKGVRVRLRVGEPCGLTTYGSICGGPLTGGWGTSCPPATAEAPDGGCATVEFATDSCANPE